MADHTVDILIEIPKGSQNKYVWDPDRKRVRLDRVLHSSIHYPADYGIVPDTMAPRGRPVAALVLVTVPTFPGCVIRGKVIGCLRTVDNGFEDTKLVAVPVHDPRLSQYDTLADVPSHLVKEIEYFFRAYKELERKPVEILGWGGADEAMETVRRYQQHGEAESQ